MLSINLDHYVDTVIYSADKIIRNLKMVLRQKIESLDIGITSEQFLVLDTICCYPNIHQQKLSEIIMKDKSNTTRILKILETEGLIEKTAGKKDSRLVYFLNITPKGKKIIDENIPKLRDFIAQTCSILTDKEVDFLHEMSEKLEKGLSIDN